MPLALSRITWKLLVGDQPQLGDLELADIAASESIKQLLNVEALGITEDEFADCFGDIRFVYANSRGEEVQLMEGGTNIPVTFHTAKRFAELVLEMRINEAAEHVACLREGLAIGVPLGCLSLWSWRDLELKVCGNPTVDIQVMQKHVCYDSISKDDDPVKFMWSALESFSQEDRTAFVRFCWGRSRLPPEGSAMWGNGFKVTAATDLPATALPRAHTCFFQIDLPPYTAAAQAKERILFAVRNCLSMQNA